MVAYQLPVALLVGAQHPQHATGAHVMDGIALSFAWEAQWHQKGMLACQGVIAAETRVQVYRCTHVCVCCDTA
jgi:hypothetical protein